MALRVKFNVVESLIAVIIVLTASYKTNAQPQLVSYELNMTPPERLILTFNEMVDPLTCDGSAVTLQDSIIPVYSYQFVRANCSQTLGGFSVVVKFSSQDWNNIQSIIDLATSVSNTFISLDANFIHSFHGTVSATTTSPLQAAAFTPNLNPPSVLMAFLDLDSGSLSMVLSEAVRLDSFNISGVTISYDNRLTGLSDSYTLSNAEQIRYTDINTIEVVLTTFSLDHIIYSQAPYSLGVASDVFMDGNGQGNTAIESFMFSSVIPDTTPPNLLLFSLDLNAEILILVFDEPVQITNISALQLVNNQSSRYSLHDSIPLTSAGPNIVVSIALSLRDLNAVKVDAQLCSHTGNCFLNITGTFVSDIQGNTLNRLNKIVSISFLAADRTSPTLVNYDIDFNNSLMILEFSEPLIPASLVITGITLGDIGLQTELVLISSTVTFADALNTVLIVTVETFEVTILEMYRNQGGILLIQLGIIAIDYAGNELRQLSGPLQEGSSYILCVAELTPPVNGSIGDYPTRALLGEQVSFRCDDGLIPTGVMTSTCTDVGGRGEWMPDPAQLMCRVPVQPQLISFELNMTPPEQLILSFSEVIDPSSCVGSALTLSSDFTGTNTYTLQGANCSYPFEDTSGFSVIIEPLPEDWRNLQSNIDLATSEDNTLMSLAANFIQSAAGGGSFEIDRFSSLAVSTFTSNQNPPFVLMASLDLNSELISVVLSEGVQINSFNTSGVTINYSDRTTGSASSYNLNGGLLTYRAGITLDIFILTIDLNIIKFYSQEPYSLGLASDVMLDGNGQGNIAINNFMFSSVIPDSIPPSLEEFSFDLNTGTLSLNFDEPVQVVDGSMLQLTDNQPEGSRYSLRSSIPLAPIGPGTMVLVELSQTDLNAIKGDEQVCSSRANCFLSVGMSVSDIQGNILSRNGIIQVNNFIADFTPPVLVNYNIDFIHSLMILEFSEPIIASSFDVTGITLFNFNQSDQFTPDSSAIFPIDDVFSTIFFVPLETSMLNTLEVYKSEGGVLLTLTEFTATDYSGNPLLPISFSFPLAEGLGYCITELTPPMNGSVGDHLIPTLIGTLVTFRCDNGLLPTDLMISTCTDVGGRGEWVPDPAQLMCTVPEPTVTTATVAPPVICAGENDPVWWLPFPDTLEGVVHRRSCPQNGTSTTSGLVTRPCMTGGVWGGVDTSDCTRQEFLEVEETAMELFAANVSDIDPTEVDSLIVKLVVATGNSTTGGSMTFPRDLNTTNNVISSAVQYLLKSVEIADSNALLKFNEDVIDVFDNILDDSNIDGWQDLQEDSVGSQQLLLNAEVYGQYVAQSLMSLSVDIGNRTDIDLVRNNVELSAKEIDPKKVEGILFPLEVKRTNETGSAQTVIPAELLKERGAENGNVSTVNILFTNLNMFLPLGVLEGKSTRPVTPVLSTQILTDEPRKFFDTPARFKYFTRKFSENETAENATCVFWDFESGISQSSWSTVGVNTSNVSEKEDGVFEVVCESSHVTSFAVLMDVTGVLNETSEEEQFALTVVSYVGCSISIFFLLLSIIYLLSLRKELFQKVHNFIHLNLAIALFLGYLVFVAGVDTAIVNRGLCVFIAALLHYLFTAAFFWMLCEGVMLYLMLVIVFSDVMKKWWVFFILGWFTPIIPVAISVGVINDQYGTSTYCWIAAGDGTRGALWAFVVPILCIIMVNIFFLLVALRSVYHQRKQRLRNASQRGVERIKLFKQLFKAMIILLPILGLTWVFGLLLVDRNLTFFAWIFTVCNSLQGLFIFYFYVLRNVKIWKSVKRRYKERRSTFSQSTMLRKDTSTIRHGSMTMSVSISSQKSFNISKHNGETSFQNPTFINEPIEEEKMETKVSGEAVPGESKMPTEIQHAESAVNQNTVIDVDKSVLQSDNDC